MDSYKLKLTKPRQRRSFSMVEKVNILERLSNGTSATKIAREYKVNESTIRHMRKQEATIRMTANCMTSKIASGSKRSRNLQISKMDACLTIWLDDLRAKRLSISNGKIKSKALNLFELIGKLDSYEQLKFSASNGWLEKFKTKYDLYELRHDSLLHGITFKNTIMSAKNEANMTYDQIFAVDNVAFNWKSLPGQEGNSKLTLLFCCNASGNFITPPVLYSMEAESTPQTAFFQSQTDGTISTQNMRNWFYTFFAPKAEKYLSESNLPEKAILLLAYEPNQPKDLVHHTIDILSFPPDLNSSFLPTARGILNHLNAVYTKQLGLKLMEYIECGMTFDEAWELFSIDDATEILETITSELDSRALRNGWARLFDFVTEEHSNFDIIKDTVEILHSIGLTTVTVEALSDHIITKELTNEEILTTYMQIQKNVEFTSTICNADIPEDPTEGMLDTAAKSALIEEINHHLVALKDARKFCEQKDPNKLRAESISKKLKQIDVLIREMKNEIPTRTLELEPIDIKIEPIEFSIEMLDS